MTTDVAARPEGSGGVQPPAAAQPHQQTGPLQQFVYNDAVVRAFVLVTVLWGVVAFLVGLIIALQLVLPAMNLGMPSDHLRPAPPAAHQRGDFRLCRQRRLRRRLLLDAAALQNPDVQRLSELAPLLGLAVDHRCWPPSRCRWATQRQGIRRAGMAHRPAIAVVWVAFAVNFFGTIFTRRERHLYVALWFYIATVVTIPVLHIFNSLEVPVGLMKSYPVYAGVQDAFMQWWYGHNAVGFLLTTPFLG